MIKYRPTTFLPLLLSYLLLGVIPSQGAAINNNPSNGSSNSFLGIDGNKVTYIPGKDSKSVVQKFNETFRTKVGKEEREATNTSLPNIPISIIDIINSYNKEIFHLNLTQAKNLNSCNEIDLIIANSFNILSFTIYDNKEEERITLLKNLPNITRLNVKGMVSREELIKLMKICKKLTDFSIDLSAINNIENIKNYVHSLLNLDLPIKKIELPESFEVDCPAEFTKLKKQGWIMNPYKGSRKISALTMRIVTSNCDSDKETISKETIKQFKKKVDKLIEEGAYVDTEDAYGEANLNFVCQLNNLEIANIVLGEKANVNVKNKFGNALFRQACRKNRLNIVIFLIEKGVDVNAKDKDEYTPLHHAVKEGSRDIVTLLIDNDADVNEKDKWGRTPLYYARQKGNLAMINLLRGNDATDNNISLHDTNVIKSTSLITKQ